MTKWQYMVRILEADAKAERDYLKRTYNWDNPPKYAPEAMESLLNDFGEQGWELIHIEPIASVGNNRDIGFNVGTGGTTTWSHTYFCVFMRPRQ